MSKQFAHQAKKRAFLALVASVSTVASVAGPAMVSSSSSVILASAHAEELDSSKVQITNVSIQHLDGTPYGAGEKASYSDTKGVFSIHVDSAQAGDIYRFAAKADTTGDYSESFFNLKYFRGRVNIMQGNEIVAKARIVGDHVIEIKFTQDVTNFSFDFEDQLAIKYGTKNFDSTANIVIVDANNSVITDTGVLVNAPHRYTDEEGSKYSIARYDQSLDTDTGFVYMTQGITPKYVDDSDHAFRIRITNISDGKSPSRFLFGDETAKIWPRYIESADNGELKATIDMKVDKAHYQFINHTGLGDDPEPTVTRIDKDTVEFYYPKISAGFSPTALVERIGYYDGNNQNYAHKVEWGYAPAETPKDSIQFNGESLANDSVVREYSISGVTGSQTGNPSIINGRLQSSTHSYSYDPITIVRPGSTSVSIKEDRNRPIPEGAVIRPYKNTQEWAAVSNDGTAVVNVSPNVAPDTYDMQYMLTYADKSTQVVHLIVDVQSQADKYSPKYEGVTKVKQGESAKVNPPKAGTYPSDAVFMNDATTPDWATVSRDGSIALKPGFDVEIGKVKLPVKIQYADGTSEKINADVGVYAGKESNKYNPRYGDRVNVKQGETGKIAKPSDAPSGATFAKSSKTPEWVTVNSDGSLSLKPGYDTVPGDYAIPVKITYSDGTYENLGALAAVSKAKNSEQYQPTYVGNALVTQNKSAEVSPPDDLPAGSTVMKNSKTPDWVTVRPDGRLKVHPGWDVNPGDYTVPVSVRYFDKSSEDVDVIVKVLKGKDSDHYSADYPRDAGSVDQGATLNVPAPTGDHPGAKFTLLDPEPYISINDDGSLVIKPGWSAEPGVKAAYVQVTYPDGSTQDKSIKFKVAKGDDAKHYKPSFDPNMNDGRKPGEINQGEASHIDPPAGVPEGTRCEANKSTPKWVKVSEDCTLDIEPGFDVKPGSYSIPIDVVFPDKTRKTINLPFKILEGKSALKYEPRYVDTTVVQGGTADVAAPTSKGKQMPKDARYEANSHTPDWVTVNEDGSVVLDPSRSTEIKDYEIGVKVMFSDGTFKNAPLKVKVVAPDATSSVLSPVYADTEFTVEAGQSTEVDAPTTNDGGEFPKGTKFEVDPSGPEWAKANENTGAITLEPGLRVVPGEHVVPVVVTYPDGSTSNAEINVNVTPAPFADIVQFEYAQMDPVKKGSVVEIAPPTFKGRLAPPKTSFSRAEGLPEYANLNTENGSIILSIPADVDSEGIDLPVEMTFYDGSHETITAHVDFVKPPVTDSVNPSYDIPDVGDIESGSKTHIEPPFSEKNPAPEGTKFEKTSDTPDWVTVNEDGSIDIDAPADAEGTYPVDVVVTYPDGSTDNVEFDVNVKAKPKMADTNAPQYPSFPEDSIKPGTHFDTGSPFEGGTPEGVKCEAGEGAVDWVKVNEDCTLSIDVPSDAKPGDYNTPIVVKYPDGSTGTITVPITVPKQDEPVVDPENENKTQSDVYAPEYNHPGEKLITFFPDVARHIDSPFAGNQPEGVTYDKSGDTPDFVTVNEDGSLDIKPTAETPSGDYTAKIIVTYKDGSIDVVEYHFIVKNDKVEEKPEDNTPAPDDDPSTSTPTTEVGTQTDNETDPEGSGNNDSNVGSQTDTGNGSDQGSDQGNGSDQGSDQGNDNDGPGSDDGNGQKDPGDNQNNSGKNDDNHSGWWKFWHKILNFGRSDDNSGDSDSSSSTDLSSNTTGTNHSGIVSLLALIATITASSIAAFHLWTQNHMPMR